MEIDSGEVGPAVTDHLMAVRLEFDAQVQRFEQARAGLREVLDQIHKGRSQREVMHDSVFARLQARLESMPVIEQAKGILMAEQRCGPDEAFDLLRRASQRANIKVSVLAAQIVEQITAPTTGLSAVPTEPTALTSRGRRRRSSDGTGAFRVDDQRPTSSGSG